MRELDDADPRSLAEQIEASCKEDGMRLVVQVPCIECQNDRGREVLKEPCCLIELSNELHYQCTECGRLTVIKYEWEELDEH